jgi:hypothetical protein
MVQICKNCSLKILDESNKCITNVTAKSQTSVSGAASGDNRGCNEAYSNTKDADKPSYRTYYVNTSLQEEDIYHLITLSPEHMSTRSCVWTVEQSVDSFMSPTSMN